VRVRVVVALEVRNLGEVARLVERIGELTPAGVIGIEEIECSGPLPATGANVAGVCVENRDLSRPLPVAP